MTHGTIKICHVTYNCVHFWKAIFLVTCATFKPNLIFNIFKINKIWIQFKVNTMLTRGIYVDR
jgi:hypothetical protein